jgi:hypothetical protein
MECFDDIYVVLQGQPATPISRFRALRSVIDDDAIGELRTSPLVVDEKAVGNRRGRRS